MISTFDCNPDFILEFEIYFSNQRFLYRSFETFHVVFSLFPTRHKIDIVTEFRFIF